MRFTQVSNSRLKRRSRKIYKNLQIILDVSVFIEYIMYIQEMKL